VDRLREPLPTRVEDTPELPAGYDAALQAAGRLKDPALEGKALGNLGLAWMQAGQYDRSADYFERAAAKGAMKIVLDARDA